MSEVGGSGLPAASIMAIQQVFHSYPGIRQAILYGSRAKGNFRPGSDIDLTVRGDLTYQQLLRIETELDDLLLPYKIDLSLCELLDNPALIEHIDRVGKLFYRVSDS